jgi:hypothetical protein
MRICSNSPPMVTTKSRLPKRTSAPGAHPLVWLAIRRLMKSSRCANPPTWYANCWFSGPSTSEFMFAHLAWMVCKEDTEVYTGLGRMSLRPVRAARVLALVCGRSYKRARERTGSQVSGDKVLCGSRSVVNSVPLSTGVLPFPFICQGAGVGYMRERERSPGSRFSSSLRVVPANPIDDDGSVPALLPSATCDVRLNRVGGAGPRCAWWATCAPTKRVA